MKIKTIVLCAIVLVVIDQIVKWLISVNYRNINIEFIPFLLEFKPKLNDKSFYWLSLMDITVGRWVRLIAGIVVSGILCLLYFYMKKIMKKRRWMDIGFIFGFAGMLCFLCDNIFFGGSWDYIYLKPLFIFDLKDLYLNCFAILILISAHKNREYL